MGRKSLILVSYLAYAKNRPELRAKSRFKLAGGVFIIWACLAFFLFVIVLLLFEEITREALLITPVWFVLLAIGYQLAKKTYDPTKRSHHVHEKG